jgi:hypothetical protein
MIIVATFGSCKWQIYWKIKWVGSAPRLSTALAVMRSNATRLVCLHEPTNNTFELGNVARCSRHLPHLLSGLNAEKKERKEKKEEEGTFGIVQNGVKRS